MSILKKYNKHLIKRGFNGPLSFHQPYKLGHIITFDKRSGFEVVGHINNAHFNLTDFTPIEKCGNAKVDIDFGTETGVNIEVKLKGDAQIPNSRLTIEDIGLVIEFENKASYLLKTGDTRVHFMENVAELGKKVNALYLDKKWNRNWFVITQLIEAERVTLFISKSRNSKIELKAKTGTNTISEDDLASDNVHFSVLSKKEMNTNLIGKEGPYFPLFKANGIKVKRLFPQPIGSSYESINEVNPMNAYTIADLEKANSEFSIAFETYDFSEELLEEDDTYMT
ncbi:MAG: hypothetical protein AAF934_09855 [Bacteroidota bacterium]